MGTRREPRGPTRSGASPRSSPTRSGTCSSSLKQVFIASWPTPTGRDRPWTLRYLDWVGQQVEFEQPAQEYTKQDYLHEVEHSNNRRQRLETAIREAVKVAPAKMQEVVQALQSLRGIAEISAVTIVRELGQISRFARARQLMAYSGAVASEDSSGKRVQRGAITTLLSKKKRLKIGAKNLGT
jgi:transposase